MAGGIRRFFSYRIASIRWDSSSCIVVAFARTDAYFCNGGQRFHGLISSVSMDSTCTGAPFFYLGKTKIALHAQSSFSSSTAWRQKIVCLMGKFGSPLASSQSPLPRTSDCFRTTLMNHSQLHIDYNIYQVSSMAFDSYEFEQAIKGDNSVCLSMSAVRQHNTLCYERGFIIIKATDCSPLANKQQEGKRLNVGFEPTLFLIVN